MTVSGTELAGCPVASIVVRCSVILGWLDGPTEGFIHLDRPESSWRFHAYAYAYDPDDLDDRLYLLCPVPDDTIVRLLDALKPLGEPPAPHWAPIWQFPDEADQARAETVLAELADLAGPPEVLVQAKDLTAGFQKVWLLLLQDGQA
jgi:hypothetical protein